MVVTKFYKEARFTQRIKLVSKSSIISGNLEYMTCDDTQCTFKPDNPFMFQLSLDGELIAKDTTINQMIVDDNEINLSLYGLLPAEMSKLETVCQNDTLTLADSENKNSLWGIFGLGFLGGLLALLTPCVFPMIPLTVSFFTKKEDGEILRYFKSDFIWLFYSCGLFNFKYPVSFNRFNQSRHS